MHEAWISREQGGLYSAFGWIHHFDVEPNLLFDTGLQLDLGKVTVLSGPTGSGKTALCDWIAGGIDPDRLRRWLTPEFSLRYSVTFYSPEEHTISVGRQGDRPLFLVDKVESPIPLIPMRVVYVPHYDRDADEFRDLDDVDFVASLFGLRRAQALALLPRVGALPGLGVRRLYTAPLPPEKDAADLDDETSRLAIHGDVDATAKGLDFASWSGGEQSRVIVAIAVAVAEHYAGAGPTILLLDGGMERLDHLWVGRLVMVLESDACRFQTVMTYKNDPSRIEWKGWTLVNLDLTSSHAG